MKYPTPYWMFVQDLSDLSNRMEKGRRPFRIHQSGLADYLWRTVPGIKPHYISLKRSRKIYTRREHYPVENMLTDRNIHLINFMWSVLVHDNWCLVIRPDNSQAVTQPSHRICSRSSRLFTDANQTGSSCLQRANQDG